MKVPYLVFNLSEDIKHIYLVKLDQELLDKSQRAVAALTKAQESGVFLEVEGVLDVEPILYPRTPDADGFYADDPNPYVARFENVEQKPGYDPETDRVDLKILPSAGGEKTEPASYMLMAESLVDDEDWVVRYATSNGILVNELSELLEKHS